MALEAVGVVEIPDATGTLFDHGAFEPTTRRVFVAHTGRDRIEVIDHDTARHLATLSGFRHAAGVVAEDGHVLVTNRGAAQLAWIDADTLKTRTAFGTGPCPNGVAMASRLQLAVVACIGDEAHGPTLQVVTLDGRQRWAIDLPGRPRWCVTDAEATQVFLAIREPSMVLAARLPELGEVRHWPLPSQGAHGIDIDHATELLYIACDDGALVELATAAGEVRRSWPLRGVPDATFFNPSSGLVHVAVAEPGLVQTVDTRTGRSAEVATARGARTTALTPPDRLYVFSPRHGGALVMAEV